MKILLVHTEAKYCAGAEKMLAHYMEKLLEMEFPVMVTLVKESPAFALLPKKVPVIWLPSNQEFSFAGLFGQTRAILQKRKEFPFDLVHGWAARSWELTTMVGWTTLKPAIGTLHDHPRAAFISSSRRRLMKACAHLGLRKIVCVSEAVRQACFQAHYPKKKLAVIHNGLPLLAHASDSPARSDGVFKIGFLGAFSERKGLRGLFQMIKEFAGLTEAPWELRLAGGPQDEAGEKMMADLEEQFAARAWWPRVHQCGWVNNPLDFLQSIDVLVCPSADFDPFPTVLLEAGLAGIPVLACRVGGVEEIVLNGKTGWLVERGEWRRAGEILASLLEPAFRKEAGERAGERIRTEFNIQKMVARHLELYSTLIRHVE